MISDFTDILNRLGMELSAREIAEALFLAARMEPAPAQPLEAVEPTETSSPDQEESAKQESRSQEKAPRLSPEKSEPEPPKDRALHPASSGAAGSRGGMGAVGVRVAAAIAMPGARGIARALRPLLRLHPSRTRRALDLDRTIEATAETGVTLTVQRSAPERWLDVALVVDEGATMRAWHPSVREFKRLLERLGAFRDVTVWGMNTDDGEPKLYRGIGRAAPPARLRDARELLDAEGRRLILVLTDCMAPGWRDGRAFQLLAEWGRRAPVLLVQLLPQRLWGMTAMPAPTDLLQANEAGLPNARLRRNGRLPDPRVPVPVAVMEEWAFAPWARMLAARGTASANGFLIPSEWPIEQEDPEHREEQRRFAALDAVEQARLRVEEFRAAASPAAFRLACYLTAVELSLPVMRLVQQAMMPDSRQLHLAEVFLGDLIRPTHTGASPDEHRYAFHPGVAEYLVDRYIDPREWMRVVAEVSLLIEKRLPTASDFRVLLARPDAREETEAHIALESRPFGFLSALVAERLIPSNEEEEPLARGKAAPPSKEPVFDSILALLDEIQNNARTQEAARALGNAVANHDLGDTAACLSAFASSLEEDRQIDPAMRFYEHLLELGRRLEVQQYEIEALIGIGNLYLLRSEAEKAKEYFDRAFPLASRVLNQPWEAGILAKLARAYGQYPTATDLNLAIQCADRVCRVTTSPELIVEMRLLIGNLSCNLLSDPSLLAEAGDRFQIESRARQAFTEALDRCRSIGDRQLLCRALIDYGRFLALINEVESAKLSFDNAAEGFRRIQNKEGEARALDALGDLQERLGAKNGIVYYRQALRLLHQLTPPPQDLIDSLQAKLQLNRTTFEFTTVTLDSHGKEVKENGRRTLSAHQLIEELAEGVVLEMVEIPPGEFLMGSPDSEEAGSYADERPQHIVTIRPFYIGKFAVTQAQWRVIAADSTLRVDRDLKPDPSNFKGDDRPVEQVTWHDAKEFCARLSKMTGREYRLPTEAEWEYACRAGTTAPFAFGETITHETVNYNSESPYAKAEKKKSRRSTILVGSLGVANSFGLYDMHGNVWEWCEDIWHDNYNGAPADGSAWLSGGNSGRRVLRGGSWGLRSAYCRSAYRYSQVPGFGNIDVGFRVVLSVARTP